VQAQFGADFDRRVFSREAAKNAKEKICFSGHFVLSLEDAASAREFRPLRVLCGFA
jgi:hypothetical protein